jgi:hypothetical protein
MYVVIYKDRVVLGIIPWDNQYIMDVMRSRYRETIEIPYTEPNISEFPLQINDNVKIYPAEEDRTQAINPLVEYYYGPSWEFLENKVIAHYTVNPHDLSSAKNNYRDKASLVRYQKEISGTTVTINDHEYFVETDRTLRTKYAEKLISMEEDVNWKFQDQWVILSKADMQMIVNAINAHVQSTFDEEYYLNLLIEQAESLEDLLAIEELNKRPSLELMEQNGISS